MWNLQYSLGPVVLLIFSTHAQWELIWSDEFDGDSINLTNWYHESTAWGQGSHQFQVYSPSPENSWVENGQLNIKPTLLIDNINPLTKEKFGWEFLRNGTLNLTELYGYCTRTENRGCYREGQGFDQWTDIPPTASAFLTTNQSFGFQYGRVVVRAKVPTGDWLWPAIWLLPEEKCYGNWPVSGEIDMTETRSNEDFVRYDGMTLGMQRMESALHWGVTPGGLDDRYNLTKGYNYNGTEDYGRHFHLYRMDWTPSKLSLFVDDTLVFQVPENGTEQDWQGFFEFGKPWTTINESDPSENPWSSNHSDLMVPFDIKFHIILNVAVGGTNGFFPSTGVNRGGAYPKPWPNGVDQHMGMNLFYGAKEDWLWTWEKEGDNNNMKVDYVRVYKRHDMPEESDCPA